MICLLQRFITPPGHQNVGQCTSLGVKKLLHHPDGCRSSFGLICGEGKRGIQATLHLVFCHCCREGVRRDTRNGAEVDHSP